MEILNIDIKEKEIKENMQDVIKRIFAICKNDEGLRSKDKIKSVEEKISLTTKKVKRQQDILKQAQKIKADLEEKTNDLNEKNFTVREKLLEDLGSEL